MKYKSYQKAIQYLESLIPDSFKKKFPAEIGLKRMKAVLEKLNNPQNSFKSIHIAGTSGKGSTSYLVAKILQELGFKVGLHMSPHLQTIRERMIINRHIIPKGEFVDLLNDVIPAINKISKQFTSPVTYFECLIAMTYLYFKKKKIDYGVIETGLGGTYDGTNVLNSLITIITKIGFDHTNILGTSIVEIASQKAGIIQETNVACISQSQVQDAEQVIKNVCIQNNVPLYVQEKDYFLTIHSLTIDGCIFTYKDSCTTIKNIALPLLGRHQINNAGVAIKAVLELEKIGVQVNKDKIKKALHNVHFPGRMEFFKLKNQQWILDGAHNEDKISAFISSLKNLFPVNKKIAIIGFKKDKDINTCLKILIPYFETIVCTKFHTLTDVGKNMAFEPQELKEYLIKLGYKGKIIVKDKTETVIEYINNHTNKNTINVVTGSLYLVGEVRSKLGLPFSL